jgi:hypothetical protein
VSMLGTNARCVPAPPLPRADLLGTGSGRSDSRAAVGGSRADCAASSAAYQ